MVRTDNIQKPRLYFVVINPTTYAAEFKGGVSIHAPPAGVEPAITL